MRMGKLAQLIKKMKNVVWINTKEGDNFIATGLSIYRADGTPNVEEEEQVAKILDIEEKKAISMLIEIQWDGKQDNILGYDLSEGKVENEVFAERMSVAAQVNERRYEALRCENGEIFFFDENLVTPLADVFKNEWWNISYSIRRRTDGNNWPYIVIKNGFITIAAIRPAEVLSDDYLRELQDFMLRCADQLRREKQAARDEESEE